MKSNISGMMERPYYIDFGTFRLITHKLVTSKYFDLAISAVIGLNVITMAMEFYMMPPHLSDALKIFNYFFTTTFCLEACLKVAALGPERYFSEKYDFFFLQFTTSSLCRWNQLDIAIVGLSVLGIVLEEIEVCSESVVF